MTLQSFQPFFEAHEGDDFSFQPVVGGKLVDEAVVHAVHRVALYVEVERVVFGSHRQNAFPGNVSIVSRTVLIAWWPVVGQQVSGNQCGQ